MDAHMEARIRDIADYMVLTGATVREVADMFGVSKSTVHKDLTQRMVKVDGISPETRQEVRRVLDCNKQERHIRGGIATRMKFKGV